MTQRDTYVDVAKGICMLLIICIHTEVFGVIGMPLTFIAVPMFFFMSGFYDRSEKRFNECITKSVKSLVMPALIWAVLGSLYILSLSFIKEHAIPNLNLDLINPCRYNGPVWFLFSLFYVKLVIWCVIRLKLPKYIIALITFVIGYIGSEYQMPLYIDEALAAVPLYYMGKILYPRMRTIIDNKYIALVGLLLLLVFVFTPYYYNIGPTNHLFHPYYLVAISGIFVVFFLILSVSRYLQKIVFLQNYGKRTLGIMLMHAPICHTAAVVINRVFPKESTPWIISFIVAYVVIVFISYFLTGIIERRYPRLLGK